MRSYQVDYLFNAECQPKAYVLFLVGTYNVESDILSPLHRRAKVVERA